MKKASLALDQTALWIIVLIFLVAAIIVVMIITGAGSDLWDKITTVGRAV